MTNEPLLLQETLDNVRWIRLNRGQQRNPLSQAMLLALTEALDSAAKDSGVRAIVLASSGPVFSAGHDLTEMGRQGDEALESQQARMSMVLDACSAMMLKITHSPKAVIACVQGTATAAGCQLVSACDLAFSADTAKFCTPGVSIGGFCTTPLVGIGRNIHRKHAMEMALTGNAITAERAERMGLINESCPADELETRVTEIASHIAAKSAMGIRLGKADFYKQIDMPLEDAFAFANTEMVKAMTSSDAHEGSRAFFEKRMPEWGEA